MAVSRNGINGGHFYSNIISPHKVDVMFTVDSTNVNGLGVSSVKSNGFVAATGGIFMNTQNGPTGTPAMGTSRSYGILAATAITNTGSSALTGNVGEYPGTAVTGFPPGTYTGALNVANTAAQQAQADALVAYTDLQARTPTTIATDLGGQSLTAGVYNSAGGTFTLAGAGAATLTLTGSATDIFVFRMATTLTTGAGGIPTITLAGGALASNIYWVVGSSATINSGFTGTFKGNIIALTSITDTLGGTVNGSLIALNGAVTLSAATTIVTQALTPAVIGSGSPNPAAGYLSLIFNKNYNKYLGHTFSFRAPYSGTNIAINGTSLTIGNAYVITSLGTSTAADWIAVGLPRGFTATVGQSFIALATGDGAGTGTGQVQTILVSGVDGLEAVGDPTQEVSNAAIAANGGARLLLKFLLSGVLTAPEDGTVVSLSVYFDDSSVTVDGL